VTLSPSQTLAQDITHFLKTSPVHSAWVGVEGPLPRRSTIRTNSWMQWFLFGGHAGRPGYLGPVPRAISAVAIQLLGQLPSVNASEGLIDRKWLVDLAVAAGNSNGSPADLTRLWLSVMMWGSGKTDKRGPWRTATGLVSPRLIPSLQASWTILQQECNPVNAAAAYTAFLVPKCGPSFFTKWLWACSLAGPKGGFSPLILDRRIRLSLYKVMNGRTAWNALRGPVGYVHYLNTMHEAVALIARGSNTFDAEKLEWLLFDRGNHPATPEPCFM
jgi:hypothetical protein